MPGKETRKTRWLSLVHFIRAECEHPDIAAIACRNRNGVRRVVDISDSRWRDGNGSRVGSPRRDVPPQAVMKWIDAMLICLEVGKTVANGIASCAGVAIGRNGTAKVVESPPVGDAVSDRVHIEQGCNLIDAERPSVNAHVVNSTIKPVRVSTVA